MGAIGTWPSVTTSSAPVTTQYTPLPAPQRTLPAIHSGIVGAEYVYFGRSVAIEGDIALAGAPGNYPDGDVRTYVGWSGLDCNENGVVDGCDIGVGPSSDENSNGIPDECESFTCDGDANGDGTVDPLDSGFVLARFGCEVGGGDPGCDIADQNGDGFVDPLDAGYVLARFGPCL